MADARTLRSVGPVPRSRGLEAREPSAKYGQALRAALGLALHAADPVRWPEPCAEGADSTIARVALAGGIAAEVHRGAQLVGAENLAEELADRQRAVRLSNLKALALAERVQRLCRDAGVPTILFKGLAVAGQTRTDPLTREAADIDLLVPVNDLVDVHRLLVGAGARLRDRHVEPRPGLLDRAYRRFSQETGYILDGIAIDVHWYLGFQRRSLPDTLHALSRRQMTVVRGTRLPTLSLHDALVHSAAHWRYERYGGLKYIVDILGLLQAQAEPRELPAPTLRGIGVARALAVPDLNLDRTPFGVVAADWRMATSSLPLIGGEGPRWARLGAVRRHFETTPEWSDRLEIPLRSMAGPAIRCVRALLDLRR